MKKQKYACEMRKIGELLQIQCSNVEKGREPIKEMFCVFGSKGKSGGLSGLGFGAQYGTQGTAIKCFSEGEIREEVAKKLGVKKDNIKWIKR